MLIKYTTLLYCTSQRILRDYMGCHIILLCDIDSSIANKQRRFEVMECYKNLNIEDMDNEVWLDINGFEGLYKVSNLGRVKSLQLYRGCNCRILKQVFDSWGYLKVGLCKEGKQTTVLVHRLVSEHFIENPKNLPQVNHISENKTDNSINNLEWCDAEYNNNYGTRTQRTSKAVIGYSKITGEIIEFPSTKEAERVLGIYHSSICECCNGKRKSAGGYTWHYAED